MKKTFICFCLLFYCGSFFSQSQRSSSTNFIIGLPKVTAVQLNLLKNDLLDLKQILNAEYIHKEHCLLIQSDFKTSTPLMYEHIEKVLLRYFSPEDIYRKEVATFDQMVQENIKSDKFIIKTSPN